MGAHFEALDEGVRVLPLEPRYTHIGFNLVSVQVCCKLLCRCMLSLKSWKCDCLHFQQFSPMVCLEHGGTPSSFQDIALLLCFKNAGGLAADATNDVALLATSVYFVNF